MQKSQRTDEPALSTNPWPVCTKSPIRRAMCPLARDLPARSQSRQRSSFRAGPFQREAINCLDNAESVMVSAHTSAGKTVVALYAIAMSLRDQQRFQMLRNLLIGVAKVHDQPCHVVYTDYRPTPLQHYIFPSGGDGLYLVVDEKSKFKEDNFQRALNALVPRKEADKKRDIEKWQKALLEGNPSEDSDIFNAFHLSYNMLLNQLRCEDGDPEKLLRHSFYQFQADRALPDLEKQAKELEIEERDSIVIKEEDSLNDYYDLLQ
ncbi:hypothetical protein HPP92_013192 [Vanilla planifolia]|uniref:Uncharacterized protein n=1 Tax=Vanilla planifolia TaxID=51239 RepID=A0A835R1Y2_VANPL|nr:hypothetical protein HPP92_013192 [Vanilla planifolia]